METLQKILVERLKNGDQQAFMEIYHQLKDSLAYKLLKLVKSEVLVQELLQDLFLKIWVNRDKIDTDKSFIAYIHTVAQHIVIDFLGRQIGKRKFWMKSKIVILNFIHISKKTYINPKTTNYCMQ